MIPNIGDLSSMTRCKQITKKGERCKNSAKYNGYCYTHRSSSKTSAQKLATFSLVLSTASTLVILIEKAAKYYPEIVGWLSMIDASTKCAGARPRPTEALRSDLEREEIWSIDSYSFILKQHLSGHSYQETPKELDFLPKQLKADFIEAYEDHRNHRNANNALTNKQLRLFEDAKSDLMKWIWFFDLLNPSISEYIISEFIDEEEHWDYSWWSASELNQHNWRVIIFAEHLFSSFQEIIRRFDEILEKKFSEHCIELLEKTCSTISETEYELKRLGVEYF